MAARSASLRRGPVGKQDSNRTGTAMSILFALGDSIAYGHWDRQGGWVQRLRMFLETRSLQSENYYELNTKNYVAVYNLGIPGETTEGLRKRFHQDVTPRLDPGQDTIIIFAIGINDSHLVTERNSHNVPLERFSKNLCSLIQQAQNITARIFLVGLTPVDEGRYPAFWPNPYRYKNEYIRTYNEEMKSICTASGAHLIDVLDAFYEADYKSLLEDGIHPNSIGHELLERVIREQLLKKGVI
jgi:lysophospholipase L1-like esterase